MRTQLWSAIHVLSPLTFVIDKTDIQSSGHIIQTSGLDLVLSMHGDAYCLCACHIWYCSCTDVYCLWTCHGTVRDMMTRTVHVHVIGTVYGMSCGYCSTWTVIWVTTAIKLIDRYHRLVIFRHHDALRACISADGQCVWWEVDSVQ
jgi:hypothetical protein